MNMPFNKWVYILNVINVVISKYAIIFYDIHTYMLYIIYVMNDKSMNTQIFFNANYTTQGKVFT